ncbi:zinc finger protein 892-like [Lytechinus pictus]|uniref:zinc finger protein 892-like n=1 Tax=Lytechinus pictus TaxID=7653 RepID=UPI0030B9BBEF
MEESTEDPGNTQSLITLTSHPLSLNNHGIPSSWDDHGHDQTRPNSHHRKRLGKMGILDQIVLRKLNQKHDGGPCGARAENLQEEHEGNDKVKDCHEYLVIKAQSGDTKYEGDNVRKKMNKRKRGRNSQISLWKGSLLEEEEAQRMTEDKQGERRPVLGTVAETSFNGSVGEEFVTQDEETMDAEVDKDISVDCSETSPGVPSVGGRFQALNAKSNVFKTKGKLFGMMSKMGDRKKHTCGECGRSFNQRRVLTIHQQMHMVQRMPELVRDGQGPREKACNVLQHRRASLPMETHRESNEVHVPEEEKVVTPSRILMQDDKAGSSHVEKLGIEKGEEVIQSRNYLQEVSEQHVKGANHVQTSTTKKRRKVNPETRKVDLETSCLDKKGYACDICKKIFSLPSFLLRHQIVHTGEKAFSCQHCGKRFGQKASLQRHEQTHGRNQPYMCNECGDGFSSSKRLERHAKEKHRASSEKSDLSLIDIPAESPKAQNTTSQDMKIPLDSSPAENTTSQDIIIALNSPITQNTTSEDKLQESATTNGASQKETLGNKNEGLETSTAPCIDPPALLRSRDPKVFTCLVCEKTFLQRSHLLRHSLCHTGEKPFKCKECGKGFTQKSTCLRHERTHSGELPFICTECGNGFAQKSGLQKHRLIHTGEKPYGCSFCECRFTQKTTCQRHERIHTGEKPYVCQECGKAFGQSTSLERHVKTHSKVKKPERSSDPS